MGVVRRGIGILIVLGLCVRWSGAQGQAPALVWKPDAKVTFSAAEQATAEVVAALSGQIGAQIGILGPAPERVTLSVKEATPDEAVAALAEALGASWIRCYVLEKAPPATPYTPDALFAGLQEQRNAWLESLTEQERESLVATAVAAVQGGAFRKPIPGAGLVRPPAQAEQPPAGEGGLRRLLERYDAVRELILPGRTESITLELQETPLPQALFKLMTASRFIVAATTDVQGTVTLKAEQEPLESVVAKIAEAVQAQWRPIYLLSVPRPMTEAELNERMEGALQRGLRRFWQMTPDERARTINRIVEGLNRLSEQARQPNPEGRPNMAAEGLRIFGPKALNWLTRYAGGLPPDQRQELKPVLQALANALAGL